MIKADLFGINLTLSIVNNGPEVLFYFPEEFTTITFYIKSIAMSFSAFKLRKPIDRELFDHQI